MFARTFGEQGVRPRVRLPTSLRSLLYALKYAAGSSLNFTKLLRIPPPSSKIPSTPLVYRVAPPIHGLALNRREIAGVVRLLSTGAWRQAIGLEIRSIVHAVPTTFQKVLTCRRYREFLKEVQHALGKSGQ